MPAPHHHSLFRLVATPLTRLPTGTYLLGARASTRATSLFHTRSYAGPATTSNKSQDQKDVQDLLEGIISGAMRGVADTQAAQQASQQGKKKAERAMDELKASGESNGDVGANTDGSMPSTQMAHGAKNVKDAGGASQGGKKMRMNQFGKMVPEDQLFAEDGGKTGLEVEGEVFGKGDPHEGKSM